MAATSSACGPAAGDEPVPDVAVPNKVKQQSEEDSVVDRPSPANAQPELLHLFKEMLDKHGGPMQYLLQEYPDQSSKDTFADEVLCGHQMPKS